jgi:hypothetical protein
MDFDAVTDYGQMWMLFHPTDKHNAFGFGHGGSDGNACLRISQAGTSLFVTSLNHEVNTTRARFEAAMSHLFRSPG